MKIYYRDFFEQENCLISEETLLYWVREKKEPEQLLFRLKAIKKADLKAYFFDPLTHETEYWPMCVEDFYDALLSDEGKHSKVVRLDQMHMCYSLSDSRVSHSEIQRIFKLELLLDKDPVFLMKSTSKKPFTSVFPLKFSSVTAPTKEVLDFVRTLKVCHLKQAQAFNDRLSDLIPTDENNNHFLSKNFSKEIGWNLFALNVTVREFDFFLNQVNKLGNSLYQLQKIYPDQIDIQAIRVLKGIFFPHDYVYKNLKSILEKTNVLSSLDSKRPPCVQIGFFNKNAFSPAERSPVSPESPSSILN